MKPHPLSLDIISTLPSSIIETILCLLPIEEAARTSILSKEWRYKWTKIPKLEFMDFIFKGPTDDENQLSVLEQTMACERKKMGRRCKLFYAIYQVLLMRQGPIHEFSLWMRMDGTCVEIDHIISFLSRNNTVKKLKLDLFKNKDEKYRLPVSVFSWHHLTDLYLHACDFTLPPTFNGFGSLTSLYLHDACISTKTLLHLLSNCPLLKRFTLVMFERDLVGGVDSTIIELFRCLPAIEELSTWASSIGCFVLDRLPQELPTSLIHLKSVSIGSISFSYYDALPFLALLIRCSPNIEKLKLEIAKDHVYEKIDCALLDKYSDIWLENLSDFQIYRFANSKFHLELVKLILAKSPKLKKVLLWFDEALDKRKESKMLRFLLRSPPASPVVEINVKFCTWLYQFF